MKLKTIQEAKKVLKERIESFNEFKDSDIYHETDDDKVCISLPYSYEGEEIYLEPNHFIEKVNEFINYKLNENKSIVRTKSKSYYPLHSSFFSSTPPLIYVIDNYTVELTANESNLLFGLISLEQYNYEKDLVSPLELFSAIKISYKDEKDILDPKDEEDIIESFRFELLSRFGFSTTRGTFYDYRNIYDSDNWDDYDKTQDLIEDEFSIELDTGKSRKLSNIDLIPYDEGIKMFLTADTILDEGYKFLSLYKIIEYYGPVALKVDAYETLYEKLDSNKALRPDKKYLESIFDLVQSFELRKRDKELIKTVFLNCIDLVDIYEKLPQYIIQEIGVKKISYKDNLNSINKISAKIAEALYSTRNQLAHAKSNYESTGLECPESELESLNEFLKESAIKVIRWYSRLPEYHK